jgi:L-methionine (R)-S-oxide reductase
MSGTSSVQLAARYDRIAEQLRELFLKTADPVARMATSVAVLHHKMPHFFWTGYYRLQDGALVVGPYQGPLACAVLPGPDGVCWAGVQREASVLVPDVEAFPGHVACDGRSRSEVVVPVRNAVSAVDVAGLERIVALIHAALD